MNKIPVILSSDNKIFYTVGAVLTSLLENASSNTFYDIHVLHTSDVTEDNKDKLLSMQKRYANMKLELHDMKNKFEDINITKGYHVNHVSAYKMLIPSMFLQYDKIIYLDTDTIVRDDLQELYQIEMKSNYLAGTPVLSNIIAQTEYFKKLLHLPNIDTYICAGVMLMNLKQIRQDEVDKKWISMLGKYEGSVDQHILNKVCWNRTMFFPLKYDVCLSEIFYYVSKEINAFYSPKEAKEAYANPSIFHWTGIYKPWTYYDTFLAQEWLYYFNLSPFKRTLERKKSNIIPYLTKQADTNQEYYFFGIPLLKTIKSYNKTKAYLFNFLPIYTSKIINKKTEKKLVQLKQENNKTTLTVLGKKIYSHRKQSEFDKIYAKRFKGLTDKELLYCIREQYKQWHGEYPDLDNPQTFNEKLTWEKLYYRNPLMTICADKVKARDYFVEKVKNGDKHLVKQLGIYDSPDEIDFEKLPNSFVLKSNWGSGKQFVVKDKSLFDISLSKKEMQNWMKQKSNHYFYAFEIGYKDITPKIICEELLDFEYKLEFFCFNGEPKFFWIVLNDKTKETQANFYKLNWEKMPIENHYPNFNQEMTKPKCYEEILQNAKQMCGDFPFVRCDFYVTKDSYMFSEMTFFHWGASQSFEPNQYNHIIGDMMKLPKVSK